MPKVAVTRGPQGHKIRPKVRNHHIVRPEPVNEQELQRIVYKDGYRHVLPYPFTFNTFVKDRWIGRTLLDVMVTEFPGKERSYYELAIADGRIQVDRQVVAGDTVLSPGQLVSHRVHRHEPPVLAKKCIIIGERDGIVAVYKPASLPVHDSGRYHFNTLKRILAHQGEQGLHTVHRIDRVTSGLVLMARDGRSANQLSAAIRTRALHKKYLARVRGVFPLSSEDDAAADGNGDGQVGNGTTRDGAQGRYITVNQPIAQLDYKNGICGIAPHGRPATSLFRRISVSPDQQTSLVECIAITGRTHQLRLHLQYLDHPIANDILYGGRAVAPTMPTAQESEEMTPLPQVTRLVQESQAANDVPVCKDCDTYGTTLSASRSSLMEIWLHSWRYQDLDVEKDVQVGAATVAAVAAAAAAAAANTTTTATKTTTTASADTGDNPRAGAPRQDQDQGQDQDDHGVAIAGSTAADPMRCLVDFAAPLPLWAEQDFTFTYLPHEQAPVAGQADSIPPGNQLAPPSVAKGEDE